MSMEEYLDRYGQITYRISGGSMRPLLRDTKDLVTIRKYQGEGLKKYDVAMYDREGKRRYVLHRVVDVGQGNYTFLGDNCTEPERQIPEGAVVGKLESFQRGGKVISVSDPGYRLYSRAWYLIFPFRRRMYRLRAAAGKSSIIKRIRGGIR